jgi:anti-sigma factor ChrR (cupin superfamily)
MSEKSVFLNVEEIPWRDTPYAGVQWKKLRYDAGTGDSSVFLRFEPGAAYGAHRHPAGEQYYVLEGSLEDGGRTYGAGTYVYHPPDSVHRPVSREGCLLVVLLPRPIEMVEAAEG